MRKTLAIIGMLLFCSLAQAQTSSELEAAKMLVNVAQAKSGVMYDFATNQVLAVNTFKLAGISVVDLNVGMLRSDGVVGAVSVDISKLKLKWLDLPWVNLVNYVNIGYAVGVQNVTLHGGYDQDPVGDNHVVTGPYASISVKF
jgi:hypothetical protein